MNKMQIEYFIMSRHIKLLKTIKKFDDHWRKIAEPTSERLSKAREINLKPANLLKGSESSQILSNCEIKSEIYREI